MSRRLPPGSHGIPAELVARNQRERLVAAMAEECAEVGYAEATVSAVAKRANVSSLTFYKQFSDKRGCMLAAHEELSERLLEAVGRADHPLAATLAIFAADPPSARLLAVEILAAGPEGAKRHDALAAAFAELLETNWVRAAGMLALVGKRVLASEADCLPGLEKELAAAVLSKS